MRFRCGTAALIASALLSTALPSAFAEEPTGGPFSYHQLRTLSALSGVTMGVDEDGRISLSGPVAFSTPVANTLGHGKFWLAGGQYSFSHKPIFDQASGNWNYYLMYGGTVGKFNYTISDNIVDTNVTQLVNLQAQYIPPKGTRWIFAAGVEDLFNGSPTRNNNNMDAATDTTVFGVVSFRPGGTGRYPIWISAGQGSHRFAKPFGSASIQVAQPLRIWGEFDGFGANEGLLYTLKLGHGKSGHPLGILVGAGKSNYFLFGLGIGL